MLLAQTVGYRLSSSTLSNVESVRRQSNFVLEDCAAKLLDRLGRSSSAEAGPDSSATLAGDAD